MVAESAGRAVRAAPGKLVTALVIGLALALPLALTLYAWRFAADAVQRRNEAEFSRLAVESERALLARLDSYQAAIRATAAFLRGTPEVSREQWNRYVATLELPRSFPGINGLGWVEVVPGGELAAWQRRVRIDAPAFQVHPVVDCDPCYVTRYIAPEATNRPALGLNIAFEGKRLQAAVASRDTGTTAITGPITLVQDEERTPGFLMFHPVYRDGMPLGTVGERRAALRGWIIAPFIARNLLARLTAAQDATLTLRIHDGAGATAELIYGAPSAGPARMHAVQRDLALLERRWLVEWESTTGFEDAHRAHAPLGILAGGILLSVLTAVFAAGSMLRRTQSVEKWGSGRFALLPIAVFLALLAGGHALRAALRATEETHVRRLVADDGAALARRLESGLREALLALQRIAERWEVSDGLPRELWRIDAQSSVQRLAGLQSLEWIDERSVRRWSEPEGAGRGDGSSVLEDARLGPASRIAADRDEVQLTEPRLLAGGASFAALLPMQSTGRDLGLLAATFDLRTMLERAVEPQHRDHYAIALLRQERTQLQSTPAHVLMDAEWTVSLPLRFGQQEWQLRVLPTQALVSGQTTAMPDMLYLASVLIAALGALSLRYILLARAQRARLAESSQMNAAILNASAHLVIASDTRGRIVSFNPAAEQALGYSAGELIGKRTPQIWHDPDELAARAASLATGTPRGKSLGVVVDVARREGQETREWTFIRRDGSRFPVSQTVTPLRDPSGEITGFMGIAEDISRRREMERLKEEFVAVVSHELRTPLTSISASLGLIVGSMAQELPARAARLITIAHNNCERLIALVNDILDSDKLASGRMRLDLVRESLADITSQAIAENEGYARRFGVDVQTGPIDPVLQVQVDRARYMQILANLLSNAAKFSPAGGTVRVSVAVLDGHARISVADQGPGIPPEFRTRIFERFSQADSSSRRRADGTGLGLYISRQLARQMGGRIGFSSEPGEGTTFWVEFPALWAEPSVSP